MTDFMKAFLKLFAKEAEHNHNIMKTREAESSDFMFYMGKREAYRELRDALLLMTNAAEVNEIAELTLLEAFIDNHPVRG